MKATSGMLNKTANKAVDETANERKEDRMFVRWLLFETRLGLALLALLEQKVGLAVVDADWLGAQPSGVPTSMDERQ